MKLHQYFIFRDVAIPQRTESYGHNGFPRDTLWKSKLDFEETERLLIPLNIGVVEDS